MIYLYPTVKKAVKHVFSLCILLVISQASFSQLYFNNPVLFSGTDNEQGAVYQYINVAPGINAFVKIDSLVNGSTILSMDDNGFGYDGGFQPQIKTGGRDTSYALFTLSFVSNLTGLPVIFPNLTATILDIDGNNQIKEFAELNLNNGIPNLMSLFPQINLQNFSNRTMARNTAGIEVGGIDTSAKEVMFQVKGISISTFTLKFGTVSQTNSKASRQYSLYFNTFSLPAVLPVSLISFQANLKDKTASLNWISSNHYNFSHYVVEKSTDGRTFEQAAVLFVDANYSNASNGYTYKDNLQNSSSKVVYYRLKMVDTDEKYAYSEVRMVRLATENKVQISTFPNPVVNELRVMVPAEWQEKAVTYEIYNSTGVMVSRVQNSKASQIQQLNVQQLNSGNYIVKVSNGSAVSTSKIVKIN